MAYSIEKTRSQVGDIKKRIEAKQGELAGLEQNKQALLDAGMEVQGSNLDERTQQTVMDAINSALDANAQKGQELSSEMNDDLNALEDMKQETQESMDSNAQERSSLESKKALLDKFGLGGSLDRGISDLDNNRQELGDVQQELIDAQKQISDTAAKLGGL